MDEAEIALRAYVDPKRNDWCHFNFDEPPKAKEQGLPQIVAVLDTETTADQYLNLTFGSLGIWIGGKLDRFIIFYSEKIRPNELEVLKAYAKKLVIENVHSELLPLKRFIDDVFYPVVYDTQALLVGFTL